MTRMAKLTGARKPTTCDMTDTVNCFDKASFRVTTRVFNTEMSDLRAISKSSLAIDLVLSISKPYSLIGVGLNWSVLRD